MCVCMLSPFGGVQLFATLWIIAHQAPLSMWFSRQEYWSGLPCPLPDDLPDPGMEPLFLLSPALAGEFFTTSATCSSITEWCIQPAFLESQLTHSYSKSWCLPKSLSAFCLFSAIFLKCKVLSTPVLEMRNLFPTIIKYFPNFLTYFHIFSTVQSSTIAIC